MEPGQLISHYELIEKIGEGGMGHVYKARDAKLNHHVAIKLLPPDLTSDEERRLRFRREAQAAAALDHPHIAVIHEVGEHEGNLFIVMQYLEGQSLGKLIGQRPLPLKEWLRLAIPIAEGLTHAHKHGIVHRDLKPDNVMLTNEGQVKLLDFGLAKLLEPEAQPGGGPDRDEELNSRLATISRELTRAGNVMGTIAYMSPEQARGESVDHRSDLFSFGVILYEMARGERPFKGKSEIESLHSTIAQDPQPLSQRTGGIPTEVERVVRKAMEKEPERRYQDAADLATDLKNLKRDLDTGRTAIPSAITSRPARWHTRWAIVAGIGVAMFLAVGAAYFYFQSGEQTGESASSASENGAIAVVGFENLNDPGDSEQLGRMLMGLITTDLAEAGGLTVVSTPKVLAALRQVSPSESVGFDVAVASDAARVAGAQVMLVGQVGRVGDGLILTAELVDVESGQTLASRREEAASAAELFALAGAIGAEVRERLGSAESDSDRDFDLARALTSSTEAYRQYATGEIALHQMEWPEAIERFGRAIQEDPTFALAYYRQAFVQDWYGDSEAATTALDNGLPHIDRLPPRWQAMYRAYQEYNQGDNDAAYDALTELIASSPDLPDAYYILGEITVHDARYTDFRKAREIFERVLEIDPTYKIVFFHLIQSYIVGEDIAAARRLLERYRAEDPNDPAVTRAEVTLLAAEGRTEEAIAKAEDSSLGFDRATIDLLAGNWERAFTFADEFFRSMPEYEAAIGLNMRGLAQAGRGHLEEALHDLERAAELTRGTIIAPAGARWHVHRALLLEAAGNVDGAVGAARDAIALDPLALEGTFYLGRILLDAGKRAEAEEALARLQEQRRESQSPLSEFWDHLLQAEIELAKGNLPTAQEALDRATSLAPEYRDRVAEGNTRSRIAEASGNLPRAIAAYREMQKPTVQYAWGSPVDRTLALYELARLEDQAGDQASARQHYEDFLDRWGDADLTIPAVAEAKDRLAILTP